jgi:MFS family permease
LTSPEAAAPQQGLTVPDEAERARVQKRTLTVVVISQVLGGAGLAAGITVGALLAQDMLGSDGLAGLPTALFTLGSALAAFLVGRLTQRSGRRLGLGLGFGVGGLGAIGVVVAAVTGSVPLLFVALFVYGSGTATNLQARYAGTDLAPAARRGTAVSVAMVSTTVGAVAGPNLVEPLGGLATSLGIPALAGPFLLAAVAYLAAGGALLALLRPDPYLLARAIDAAHQATQGVRDPHAPVPKPGIGAYVGATVMVLTQIAMIAIMTMTPVHMRAHHHELGAVGLVIGLHVGAMYLPSLVTGMLVDKVGRTPMAVASGVTLLAAGVVAALSPGDSLGLLVVALVLLGLGWNFGLISGTALVVDATVPENRPRTQGTIDVLIALAGAGGGAMSGVVMSATSYGALSLAGGFLALLLVPVLIWARRGRVTPA